jgi:hypothetical protein
MILANWSEPRLRLAKQPGKPVPARFLVTTAAMIVLLPAKVMFAMPADFS